jgi:hypothetical protein
MYYWFAAAGGFLAGALLIFWVRFDCRQKMRAALDLHLRLYHPAPPPAPPPKNRLRLIVGGKED